MGKRAKARGRRRRRRRRRRHSRWRLVRVVALAFPLVRFGLVVVALLSKPRKFRRSRSPAGSPATNCSDAETSTKFRAASNRFGLVLLQVKSPLFFLGFVHTKNKTVLPILATFSRFCQRPTFRLACKW
jgi:hypothetical protein